MGKKLDKPKKTNSRHRMWPFAKTGNNGRCYEAARGEKLNKLAKIIKAHKPNDILLNLANAMAPLLEPGPWTIRVTKGR